MDPGSVPCGTQRAVRETVPPMVSLAVKSWRVVRRRRCKSRWAYPSLSDEANRPEENKGGRGKGWVGLDRRGGEGEVGI
jgi:hypothetical protein